MKTQPRAPREHRTSSDGVRGRTAARRAAAALGRALRRLAVAALLAGFGCGGDSNTPDDVTVETDRPAPDVVPQPDTTNAGTECCPLGVCSLGNVCVAGACLPEPGIGQCYFDGQCAAGQRCDGAESCACGATDCASVPGQCRYPSGCCNDDAECGGGRCVSGQCQAAVADGCWVDADCTQASPSCENIAACACGDTTCDAKPGVCGIAGRCCTGDSECGAGQVCRGGACFAAPAADACFEDRDCSGGAVCHGATLCPCGADEDTCTVPTTAGTCLAPDDACCSTASDCDAGNICIEGKACAPAPEDNGCYVDGHCGVGRVCVGAHVCDCGAEGCEMVAGQCLTTAVPCSDDGDCGAAMVCVIPDPLYCPDAPPPTQGVCVAAVDQGCWASAECHQDLRCASEVVCLDPEGCDEPNVAGECAVDVRLRDCCNSHIECEPGTTCRNQNTSLTCPPSKSAVCLAEPEYGTTCWNLHDCPDGFVCNLSWICGCNGKCYRNRIGKCEQPKYCQSNLDCGADRLCAKNDECAFSPCTSASTCNIGGRCQLPVADRCWTHAECGDGNYCAGLQVCPSDATCFLPDGPGTCEPRGALGQCCTSYRGCEPGLRCVSVQNKTGCNLDATSVCVPAITAPIECYADDDCDSGQTCSGAVVCPCGVDTCDGPPIAGICVGTTP